MLLPLLLPGHLPAQSALDGFDPSVTGGSPVFVVVVQPDGKILLGGSFSSLFPNGGPSVPRNNIARLNPDGTVDLNFDPNVDSPGNYVSCIAVQPDGKILIGGTFTHVFGQTRNYLARLDATTGLADSFNPDPNSIVESITVQADGKILVGGAFGSIGGQPRPYIARLDPSTGQADSFNPSPDNGLNSVVVQADGKILAGGYFMSIGGQPRHRIARLDPITGLADSFNPNANDWVYSIAVQADGKILAGGLFNGPNSIGGQTRNRIARLDPTTGLADSFNPNANMPVRSLTLQPDGKVLASGTFTSVGGQSRNLIARLDSITGLADSFDPNANGDIVYSLAVQADGKVVAGGRFNMLAPSGGPPVLRYRIARLEKDGRLDQTLNANIAIDPPGSGGGVVATATQPDGKIVIGGSFSSVLGVDRHNIARLNTDGSLDLAFNPDANVAVNAIAIQDDGKLVVGGNFTTIGDRRGTGSPGLML